MDTSINTKNAFKHPTSRAKAFKLGAYQILKQTPPMWLYEAGKDIMNNEQIVLYINCALKQTTSQLTEDYGPPTMIVNGPMLAGYLETLLVLLESDNK
jgi:hypothetical protein